MALPGAAVPKVKRKPGRPPKEAGLTPEERRQRRLQCNRVAAKRAYQKKKKSMSYLENENRQLLGAMDERKKTLHYLEEVVRNLRTRLQWLIEPP